MKRPRILYIDVPFENEPGGDKNRSRFLIGALGKAFDVDLVLVRPAGLQEKSPDTPLAHRPVLELDTIPGPWYRPASVHKFAQQELGRFSGLLDAQEYDFVFTRFNSHWDLANVARLHRSKPHVIVDLDMLSSRLVGLAWRQNRALSNRWYLFEKWKLTRMEHQLFRRPFLTLLSNPVEMENVRHLAASSAKGGRLAVTPNVMPELTHVEPTTQQADILFFGSMNSSANSDGFRFMMLSILPLLKHHLTRLGIKIQVVGKNPPESFVRMIEEHGARQVELIGRVDSMEQAIANSRFVFLPLRIASGTRTRILEAAAQRRAVVTTPIGAEGIEVGDDALVHADPDALAQSIMGLIESPETAADLGRRLHDRCARRYSEERVANDLIKDILSFKKAGKTRREPGSRHE